MESPQAFCAIVTRLVRLREPELLDRPARRPNFQMWGISQQTVWNEYCL